MAFLSKDKISPTRSEVIFKDIPLNFIPHPVTKTINPLKNTDAIKQALKNLILTNHYETPYNPLFGGNIVAMLFENFNQALTNELKIQIKEVIKIYEPRAILENVIVKADEDRNNLSITIVFRPENQVNSLDFGFTVQRVF
jgi:phage baseplate assembly protein W